MSDLCHIYYHEYLVKHWQSIAAVWAVQASQSPRTAVWSGLTFLLTDGSRYSLITEWPAVTEPFREFSSQVSQSRNHFVDTVRATSNQVSRSQYLLKWDYLSNNLETKYIKSWQSAGSVLRRGNSIFETASNCPTLNPPVISAPRTAAQSWRDALIFRTTSELQI